MCDNQYHVIDEDMVFEDGKFYPMMKAKRGVPEPYTQVELRYGKRLLAKKHPVLKQFLEKEVQTKETILTNLELESGEHIENRKKELKEELLLVKEALKVYL